MIKYYLNIYYKNIDDCFVFCIVSEPDEEFRGPGELNIKIDM